MALIFLNRLEYDCDRHEFTNSMPINFKYYYIIILISDCFFIHHMPCPPNKFGELTLAN